MSLGTSINSSLFMSDPVTVRITTNQERKNKNKKFFYKGADKNLGSNDVFIVKNQNGSFQFNRNTFRETVSDLKSQSNTPVRKLDSKHLEMLKNVLEALKIVNNSKEVYDLAIKDIQDIFSDVRDVKPGTVSSFFIGCFNTFSNSFPGPMGCNPRCAGSITPQGLAECDDLVLIYSEGTFNSLNNKTAEHAYIYIDDPKFQGFNQEEISKLRNSGVKNITLVFNQNGAFNLSNTISIDELSKKIENTQTLDPRSLSGMIFVFIIILVSVLVFLFIYRNYYNLN